MNIENNKRRRIKEIKGVELKIKRKGDEEGVVRRRTRSG
jgi:hypothetical protein